MSDEERNSLQGLVDETAETADVARKLHDFLEQGKELGRKSWRLLAQADEEAEAPPPMLKMISAKP